MRAVPVFDNWEHQWLKPGLPSASTTIQITHVKITTRFIVQFCFEVVEIRHICVFFQLLNQFLQFESVIQFLFDRKYVRKSKKLNAICKNHSSSMTIIRYDLKHSRRSIFDEEHRGCSIEVTMNQIWSTKFMILC